jgi:hypothetical protein
MKSYKVTLFPALLAALLISGKVIAHEATGSLGANARFVDYYQVTCSDDGSGAPASLLVQIRDNAPAAAPLLEVVVHKGIVARGVNAAAADPGVFSTPIAVNGTAGVFNVFVRKTGAAAENYTLSSHCMTGANGTGLHTGTGVVLRQNQ